MKVNVVPRRIGARAADALWRRARSGSGVWLAAAIVASGLRLLRHIAKREREVVFQSELAAGEQLVIRLVQRGEGDDLPTAEGT
ncbi:hypothetical protein [Candidatus Poriferisodalis sp.]|uniref:hypothetical protein n=1 Tax=Candidatus Poriferisodalis sp. TaxID=3101277 RepID=UPI003B526C1E